jgi:hypothetical protein
MTPDQNRCYLSSPITRAVIKFAFNFATHMEGYQLSKFPQCFAKGLTSLPKLCMRINNLKRQCQYTTHQHLSIKVMSLNTQNTTKTSL